MALFGLDTLNMFQLNAVISLSLLTNYVDSLNFLNVIVTLWIIQRLDKELFRLSFHMFHHITHRSL